MYSNVGTPRFYIDWFQYLQANGLGESTDSVFGLNPTVNKTMQEDAHGAYSAYFYTTTQIPKINYFALLGHRLYHDPAFSGVFLPIDNLQDINQNYYLANMEIDYEINMKGGDNGSSFAVAREGFSIVRLKGVENIAPIEVFHLTTGIHPKQINAFSIGSTYTLPHSPELSLTMTREMDGVKRVRTRGGSDLVKHQYIRSPKWGDLAPWELSNEAKNQDLARVGRRTWDLSFNYLQDSDIFPDLSNVGWEGSYEDYDDSIGNTLLEDNTFFSQVIHKTNGGQLPFIFQPDQDNNNIDAFAICKFDMDTFEFEQVANGIYNIKLKIREVW